MQTLHRNNLKRVSDAESRALERICLGHEEYWVPVQVGLGHGGREEDNVLIGHQWLCIPIVPNSDDSKLSILIQRHSGCSLPRSIILPKLKPFIYRAFFWGFFEISGAAKLST
jgi:hypothetical protein